MINISRLSDSRTGGMAGKTAWKIEVGSILYRLNIIYYVNLGVDAEVRNIGIIILS